MFDGCLNLSVLNEQYLDLVQVNVGEGFTVICDQVKRVSVKNSVFQKVTIEGSPVYENSFSIEQLSFFAHVQDGLSLSNLKIEKDATLSCEPLFNKEKEVVKPFGELLIRGVFAKWGLEVKDSFSHRTENHGLQKISIDCIDEDMSSRIQLELLNCRELQLSGVNASTNIMLIDVGLNRISINEYIQKGDGEITIARMTNKEGDFIVRNSRIINSAFYFQDVDMSKWSARFSASLFKYHSLAFKRPPKVKLIDGKRDLQVELDTLNTWLFNTDQDSDIINYNDLKKEQWKLVWQKRKDEKNELPFGEICQKFVQELNDYGTNWRKPISWLLIPNLFLSAMFVIIGILCRELKTGIFNEYVEVLIGCLVPLKWTSNPDYLFGLWLVVLFFLRLWNATLIFQIISAFRVYFKK